MRNSVFEIITGACVLLTSALFLFFALNATASGTHTSSYEVFAQFDNVNGIVRGSDVRLGGVKIGVVKALSLNPDTFYVQVRLSIPDYVQLPDDTSARISTDGLLGGAYISLEPGGGFDVIAPEEEILYTRGSVDLLTLFAQFASGNGSQ